MTKQQMPLFEVPLNYSAEEQSREGSDGEDMTEMTLTGVLPCHNEESVAAQVGATIQLLNGMDQLHPEVLRQHGVQPEDYHDGLVFRSAVESIRGTYIASSTAGRQQFVGDVLEWLLRKNQISGYQQTSTSERYDFEVAIEADPAYYAAVEVKGGEGNSINISDRPMFAKEFAVWCHLDGAIVNQPSHGAHAIVNRITNELIKRGKRVDVVFFRDPLCGTRIRPCPKYPSRMSSMGQMTAPDIFLFPTRIPTVTDPQPPVQSIQDLRLPGLVLQRFGISPIQYENHLWEVHVSLIGMSGGKVKRRVEIWRRGVQIDVSESRAWKP
jgi:hypothetical protein